MHTYIHTHIHTLFLLYINDFRVYRACKMAIYADHTTFYSQCVQASALCQEQELACDLEYDPRDTLVLAGSGLLLSMLGKLNWFRLNRLLTLLLLMWK